MTVGAVRGISISISIGFGFSLGLGLGLSICLPLSINMTSITSVASVDQLAVMTNHTRGVVDPLVHLVALLGDDVLAVLDIGGVHDSVILGVADRPGHLARVLDGSLLALPFGSGMALGAAGVAVRSIGSIGISISFGLGISLPLSITIAIASMASMTSSDDLAVVSNNSGVGLNALAHLVALLSDNILAVLDVGGVDNHVILLVTNLPGHLSGVLNRPLLALPFGPGMALGSTGVSMRAMSIGRISLGISFSLGLSICLPLSITISSITSVASGDQLAVMTDHIRALVDPLVHLVTLLGDDVLAVFDVGGVDDCLVGLMALLVAVAGHTSGYCSKAGKGDKELHTDC